MAAGAGPGTELGTGSHCRLGCAALWALALRRNPRIEAVGLASGERLKYAPLLGLINRGSLAHLLSRATPGSGETEAVLRSQLIGDVAHGPSAWEGADQRSTQETVRGHLEDT